MFNHLDSPADMARPRSTEARQTRFSGLTKKQRYYAQLIKDVVALARSGDFRSAADEVSQAMRACAGSHANQAALAGLQAHLLCAADGERPVLPLPASLCRNLAKPFERGLARN